MAGIKIKSMGLLSTVFVVLLILKLCDLAAISWWWVFAPLILNAAGMALIFVVVVALGIVSWLAYDEETR